MILGELHAAVGALCSGDGANAAADRQIAAVGPSVDMGVEGMLIARPAVRARA